MPEKNELEEDVKQQNPETKEAEEEQKEPPAGTDEDDSSVSDDGEETEEQDSADQDDDEAEEDTGKEEKSGEEDSAVKKSPEYQALNEKHLRLYAEFDNFRKRSAKEALEIIQTANGDLITKLLPTLEHLDMAFAPDQKAKKLEDFEAGIKMIFNSFKDVLEDAGLEEINPVGEEFDPVYHEAMLEQHHDTIEEGHIIQVYQKGYKLKSRILQHAKVITSKGKEG